MRRAIAPLMAVLLAVLLCAGHAPPAHACSCVQVRLGREVLPADGAVDVPTDAVLRVFLTAFPESVRASLAAEYRLRDPAGTLVPLDATVVSTRLDLRPRTALQPSTEYTLEQVFAFGPTGARLGDTERWRAPAGTVRGAWYPVVRFRTGAGPATGAARAPTIVRAELHFSSGGGSCGPATTVSVATRLPAAIAATDVAELRVRGQGVVATAPAEDAGELAAGDTLCARDPITLRRGASLRVQVAIVDASGAEVGASAWAGASGRGARPRSRSHTDLLGAGGWPSIPIGPTPPAAAPSGPQSCAHGLEVVARREVVSDTAPWTYGDRSTLAGDGSAAWIAFRGADAAPLRVFALAPGRTSELPSTLPGRPEALVAGAGPLLLSRLYGAGATQSSVVSLDARGTPRWTSALSGEGGGHRLARGGGQVLAAWGARQPDHSRRLAFALLDDRSGAPIASTVSTTYGLDTNAEGPAIAFVDDRFLVAWVGRVGLARGPTRVGAIDGTSLGPAPILPVQSDGPLDLAAGGARAALVTSEGGHIHATILDRDGRVVTGPVVLSTGVGGSDNRLPRVAWDGRLFAVAWETHPAPGTYVAVIDARGTASPAVRIDGDEPHAGTVGIAPAPGGGWLASYTVDRARGMLAELRCRTGPATGAPQVLDPSF